jgi:hypothetical protein
MAEEIRETRPDVQTDRDLFKATLPFGVESVKTSWWVVGSTFLMLLAALFGAALAPVWPLRLLFSILSALLMLRAFITYHDYMHNAILSRSRPAWWLFRLYAVFSLTPPRSWKNSHNFHHGHVGNIDAASVGAFTMMTTDMWREASLATRIAYRVERHPLTILAGYFTIFFLSVTLLPFLRNPARHWDSLLVLLGHSTLIAVLWILGGFDVAFFVDDRQFLVLRSTQLREHASPANGDVDKSSSGDGVLQLPEAEQSHALVHRQHWLSSYSSPECTYPVLSIARGDGGNSRAPIARDNNAHDKGHQGMFPMLPVG